MLKAFGDGSQVPLSYVKAFFEEERLPREQGWKKGVCWSLGLVELNLLVGKIKGRVGDFEEKDVPAVQYRVKKSAPRRKKRIFRVSTLPTLPSSISITMPRTPLAPISGNKIPKKKFYYLKKQVFIKFFILKKNLLLYLLFIIILFNLKKF